MEMGPNKLFQRYWKERNLNGNKAVFLGFYYLLGIFGAFSCSTSALETTKKPERIFEKASQNGEKAKEGYIRSNAYMEAWLSYADPVSKLVPRTLDKDIDIWNAHDCAADNYPFLVLTSFFTDQQRYHGLMREMLENEIRLTSRVESLPDTYSFSKQDFDYEAVSMDRIIFGTSEYVKDGLLPLTEWLGHSPWSERMVTMLMDMDGYLDVAGGLGDKNFKDPPQAEVNGELLQVLSRMYWMTGEQRFLDWAVQIGDYFLLGEEFPVSNFDYLKLRDHGCELVSGLCELYVTLHFADKEKKKTYQQPLYDFLDNILEHGRNEDGFFYNAINPETGEVIDEALADTWGYTLNGYYSLYMVDSVVAYKNVVTKIFENLHKYRNHNWENKGADGYADAVEGAINLYNRVPDERAADWIDSEIQVMWSMQDSSHRENAQQWKNSGIIEGWYGDGNFARTSIMHNLWKSKGTYLQPWMEELSLGAEMEGDTLYISVESSIPWQGKLHFDKARHATQMNLPLDWPRINQFSEWFTVQPTANYQVTDFYNNNSQEIDGEILINGIELTLEANKPKRIFISSF